MRMNRGGHFGVYSPNGANPPYGAKTLQDEYSGQSSPGRHANYSTTPHHPVYNSFNMPRNSLTGYNDNRENKVYTAMTPSN